MQKPLIYSKFIHNPSKLSTFIGLVEKFIFSLPKRLDVLAEFGFFPTYRGRRIFDFIYIMSFEHSRRCTIFNFMSFEKCSIFTILSFYIQYLRKWRFGVKFQFWQISELCERNFKIFSLMTSSGVYLSVNK